MSFHCQSLLLYFVEKILGVKSSHPGYKQPCYLCEVLKEHRLKKEETLDKVMDEILPDNDPSKKCRLRQAVDHELQHEWQLAAMTSGNSNSQVSQHANSVQDLSSYEPPIKRTHGTIALAEEHKAVTAAKDTWAKLTAIQNMLSCCPPQDSLLLEGTRQVVIHICKIENCFHSCYNGLVDAFVEKHPQVEAYEFSVHCMQA
jgi:hypothetical protein